MKKKNKIIIIIAVIILVLTFGFVIGTKVYTENKLEGLENLRDEILEKRQEKLIEEYENKEQYIGINEFFLGKVDSEKNWKSANEYTKLFFTVNTDINVQKENMTYEDIQNEQVYFVYDENEFILRDSNIFYDEDLNPEYYMEPELFRFNMSKYYTEESIESRFICVSKNLESNYSNRLVKIEDTSSYEKYVKEVIDSKKLKSDIIINEVIQIDSNNDKNDEIYILANCPYDENNIQDMYSFVIKIENDKSEILVERVLKESDLDKVETIENYFRIDNIDFVDFNIDGKYELIVETIVWDIPEVFIFTVNNEGNQELCLYGEFAW